MARMNSGAPPLCENNNMRHFIRELFTEFVKPMNVLAQVGLNLTKKESETVSVETKNKGDLAGANQLFQILSTKPDWFVSLLDILRHRQVKLRHIADMMEEEYRIYERLSSQRSLENNEFIRTAFSSSTAASLYIEYNSLLEMKIKEMFLARIPPETILTVFHSCSNKVLTTIDIQNVRAKLTQSGGHEAALILLERLVLYDDWFNVLQQVLRHRDVKLDHVADMILELTQSTRDDYKKEKVKLQATYIMGESPPDNTGPKQVITYSADDVQVMDQENIRPASSSDEYEADSAEMKSGADVLSPSSGMAENDRHIQEQAGASLESVRDSGKTRLMSAAACGEKELLKSLIRKTSDIDQSDEKGRTALMYAANKGQVECVELLLFNKCDVNKTDVYGNTALMMAASNGRDDIMGFIIYVGADVDVANLHGSTALMIAANNGYVKCVSILLDAGCDPDKRHKDDGRTALMYAASKGHVDCVELLMDKNCDINAIDEKGFTALIYAAQKGHLKIVEQLVDGGADVDRSGKEGNSAIMWAIAYRNEDCVELLIKNNANLNIVNLSGYTPLKAAKASKSRKCVKLIKKALLG